MSKNYLIGKYFTNKNINSIKKYNFMEIKKCIICKNINDTKEHKVTKNVNIVSCNNEYCKNKVINTIDNVNKIEKYFNKNTNYIMNGDGDGDGDGDDDDDNNDDKFIKKMINLIEKAVKSPIKINEAVVRKIISTLKSISRQLLLYIFLGSLHNLVKFFYIQYNKEEFKTSFKELIENPEENDMYHLKIKTNILSVDYKLEFLGERVPNFIRLRFKNLKKLIDFIAKIDFDYIDHPEEKRNKYKYDIYSSLFEDDRGNDIKKDDAIFKTLDDEHKHEHELKQYNIYLTLIENIEQYGEKYFTDNAYEKEYRRTPPGKIDEDANEKEKKPLIRALVSTAKKQLKVPKHFIYSFRDKMKDGVDIFTLLLAFVTNKNTEWNFKFRIYKVKYNFIQYIFRIIFDRLRFWDSEKNIKFDLKFDLIDINLKNDWNKESRMNMLILFLKLSMLIPIFFGFQKHYKENSDDIDVSKKLFNNLGQNLVYIIMEIEASYFLEPDDLNPDEINAARDYEMGKIIINILNKYWIFNYKNIYTYVVQQNFTNNLYIENLNEIEKFGITYENLFEQDKLEFITKKIEMWIFYLMTESFIINEYYKIDAYKQHKSNLYRIYDTNNGRQRLSVLNFNFFLDTTTFYNYNDKTYIERLIEKYGEMDIRVTRFGTYRKMTYLPIPFFVESMVDYLNKKKMIK